MIQPHGGTLVNRIAGTDRKTELESNSANWYKVEVANRYASDCEMIANGGFSPLTGFMGKADVESVVSNMTLADGTVWAVPVVLPVSDEVAGNISANDTIALVDSNDTLIATMEVSEMYQVDNIDAYCESVYGTADMEHPGVAFIKNAGNTWLAGDIELVNRPQRENIEAKYFMDPADTRAEFESRGWNTVVAFQTRNPIHRAHEYLLKCALESTDGLLIHPLVGETKSDDIPADVRMSCYEVLMDNYFNLDKTMLSVLPANMNYAGPKEAVHHMIIRKNYGCSHMIIGRDHAGVGSYYGTYDAQTLVNTVTTDLEITPMNFEHSFFCTACGGMGSSKTCPHGNEDHVFLSGTKVREMLGNGEKPPVEFSRNEVAEVLISWATSLTPAS
jgi:sulfate adenylyltransferase